MKKFILILTVLGFFLQAGIALANTANQDTLQDPKKELVRKDSVSVDDLDPVFYEPELEDPDSNQGTIPVAVYLLVAVVVVGAGTYFFIRSKKK